MEQDEKASVAAGRYRVLYGVLSQEGKAIAWVLPGESEGVVVRPGEEATLTLGVPSSLSFGITVFRRKTGRQLTIPASSLAVVGAGKEEYVAFKYNLKAPPANRLEALKDDPVLAGGYRLYQALGKYNLLGMHPEAAAAGFEKVLEISPNYMDAIQELGFIYFSTERFEEARDLWMRGLILDPENAELRQRVHLAEDEMRKHGLLPPVSGG